MGVGISREEQEERERVVREEDVLELERHRQRYPETLRPFVNRCLDMYSNDIELDKEAAIIDVFRRLEQLESRVE